MQQLLEAGVHFGHQVRRGHPRMAEYIYGARDGVHIINLEYSEKLLKQACEFTFKLGSDGKVLLLVGTKKQAQAIILENAKKTGCPYLITRWFGGFLTNFEEIRKNIKKLNDLKEQQDKGELGIYTKKEQLLIKRKLDKFETELGGVAQLGKVPDAIYLIDCVAEKTALNEANRMGIPVIGIADSNSNPARIDYPIPGNDDATKSIKIITDALSDSYLNGLQKSKAKALLDEKKKQDKPENEEADSGVLEDVAVAEELVEKKELEESERKVT